MVLNIKKKVEYDEESQKKIYNEYMTTNISIRDISIKYNITERTMYRIKKRIEKIISNEEQIDDKHQRKRKKKKILSYFEDAPRFINCLTHDLTPEDFNN